jgi:peptidoglycan/LPS O-acetylase OafA/YrhL
MQFYLAWPVVILAICRLSRRSAVAILAILYVASTAWRWVQYWDFGWVRAYYAPDTRVSGLILGSLVAATQWRPSRMIAGALSWAAVVLLAFLLANMTFGENVSLLVGTMITELATALLVLALSGAGGGVATMLSWRPLLVLGTWSYGIYLWHFPIALVARNAFDPWAAFAFTSVLSIVLAAVSYTLLERPIIRWQRGLNVSSAARRLLQRAT